MADTSSTSARPRPLRLQFSLRLLLFAFTAFAIGFPIWYRWPYEEIAFESPAGILRRITTWQRQWGGSRLKHGVERLVSNGQTLESVTYRNGLRHGPYEGKTTKGQVVLRGQFLDDLKEGVWTAPDRTATWRRGKLHGPFELRLPLQPFANRRPPPNFHPRETNDEPRKHQLLFADGRLTHFDGQPAANRLFDLMETDVIEAPTRLELSKSTTLDVIEMPLQDTVLYLTEVHQVPIALDPKLASQIDMPITDQFSGVDLASVLMLITAPRGIACDYRYGSLWITTAEDSKDWQDPTGVAEIKPPKDSALARAWNEPVSLDAVEMPVSAALELLQERLAIHIDTTLIQSLPAPPPLPVRFLIKGLPFHHILGQLLYKTRCRCRLEGETLVILPPGSSSP